MKNLADQACELCGGAIFAHGKRRATARFCSKQCQSELVRAGRPIPCCETCGVKIEHGRALQGTARFCSRPCQAVFSKAKLQRELTQERLHEVLSYDPATGVFRWKDHSQRRATPEAREGEAGWLDELGYNHIRVDGRPYLAHRLAWLYVNGEWPPEVVDHKDGVDHGDGIENIRLATQQQNTWNSRRSVINTSGYKGVSWSKSKMKWRAYINDGARQRFLGYFDDVQSAASAYQSAAERLRGEFARAA